MYRKLVVFGLLFAALASSNSYAATEWIKNANIIRTLSDDVSYGGCMIQIDVAPASLNCPGNWYHLNCAIDKDYGKRTYSTALTAFAMGAKVHLIIDDSNKINTYCFARRLDMTR